MSRISRCLTVSAVRIKTDARFDYGTVPSGQVAALQAQASRIRGFVTTQTAAVIEAGLDLLAVKQALPGQFGQWVTAECGFSLGTAENFMRAAKFAEGRIATVTNLAPATVYKLARKSTPIEVVDAVMDRAAKGELVTDRDVTAALDKVKFQKREEERKSRTPSRQPSKRTKERWAVEEQKQLERERLEQERFTGFASVIIETLGEEQARFLIETVQPADAWSVFAVLRERLAPR